MSDDRLVELEIKVAHQEIALEELNQIIIQQQSEITKLQHYLDMLKYKIESIQSPPEKVSEELPPHY